MKLHTICALSIVLAAGCNEVEERLAWSPDGARAVLRVDDRLYFMDTNGNLSAVVASNVTGAAWQPDSRGLVLTRSLTVSKWEDAAKLLPPAEVDACQTLATSFLALGVKGLEQFELKRDELGDAATHFAEAMRAELREQPGVRAQLAAIEARSQLAAPPGAS